MKSQLQQENFTIITNREIIIQRFHNPPILELSEKSGFTEYGLAQIQKTKDFFAFLQWEKEGGWVKKWEAEQEARARAAVAKQETEQREKFQQVIFDVNKVEKDFKSGKISKQEFEKKIQNLNQTAINITETSSNKKVYESSMGPLFGIATMTLAGFGLAGPHGAAAGFMAGTVATLGTYLLTQIGAMNSVGNSIYGTLNSATGILRDATLNMVKGVTELVNDKMGVLKNYLEPKPQLYFSHIQKISYRDSEGEVGSGWASGRFYTPNHLNDLPANKVKEIKVLSKNVHNPTLSFNVVSYKVEITLPGIESGTKVVEVNSIFGGGVATVAYEKNLGYKIVVKERNKEDEFEESPRNMIANQNLRVSSAVVVSVNKNTNK